MPAIIIFGGTTEGRELAKALGGTRLEAHLCVATDYGALLLPRYDNIKIHTGRLEAEDMELLFRSVKPELVVDATHPYAAVVTENIREICGKLSCFLIRVLREDLVLREDRVLWQDAGLWADTCPAIGQHVSGRKESLNACEYSKERSYETSASRDIGKEPPQDVTFVDSVEEAAAFLAGTRGKILITTGSKELEKYTVIEDYQSRCVARVLPTLAVMEKCAGLGFTGKNLIAMQGPFSEEMNYQMLRQADCSYLVTKESGREGGYGEKCEAARRAGAKLVIVKRPIETVRDTAADSHRPEAFCTMSLWETIEYLSARYGLEVKRTAYLIGAGPGAAELFTGEAVKCLRESDCVIGAERVLRSCGQLVQKPQFCAYRAEDVAAFLKEHREYRKAALVYSGDIGFYSGAMGMAEALEDFRVIPVSGISTAQYFLDRIGAGWQDTELVSRHGKTVCLIPPLLRRGKVFALLGREGEAAEICQSLLEFGLDRVRVVVGERLSYPEERIVRGTPRELVEMHFGSLSVIYLELEGGKPAARAVTPGFPDDCFIRNKVPMTKQGIRVLSLAKLNLTENAIVYDIGAGTGSVSVEAARLCPRGTVYAVEQKREAAELLERNRVRFRAENMRIIEGSAPDILDALPAPTHVFIGGSGGRLTEIIRAVREKNPAARFVVNAVTLETMSQIGRLPEIFPEYRDMEILQVNLSRSRQAGGYHMMDAENPVMIAGFGGVSDDLCPPKGADGC